MAISNTAEFKEREWKRIMENVSRDSIQTREGRKEPIM
jgi:hypothetical protein